MKKTFIIVLLLFGILFYVEGKRLSKSRGSSSSRGSSRKTSNPQPTSISQPAHHAAPASAPKPSLFNWQEKPAQRTQPRQSQQPKQTQTHSYPSSNNGMSGNRQAQPAPHQESVQRSHSPQLATGQQSPSQTGSQANNQKSHSYPSSNGLSGGTNAGAGYPQQQGGLSGAGVAAPPAYNAAGGTNYHGPPPAYSNSGGYPKQPGTGVNPPPYNGGNYGGNTGNYHHPAPPPPYSPSHGGYGGQGGYGGHGGYGGYGGHGGYGGYGGHGGYNPIQTPQMPGYFGNNKGYGSVGRTGNILTGVGIAGAGVGTILTGLALWNLARSTGRQHHTVIYDNQGQPVAVAPDNSTVPAVDPILGDLVNCTLTVSTDNATEVLAIPCAIATSFTPEADVKDSGISNNPNDSTKCTVTVTTKAGREFMTTIPCSTLLNTAAENNVTEPPLIDNGTNIHIGTINPPGDQNVSVPFIPGDPHMNPELLPAQSLPAALPLADSENNKSFNCTPEPGDVRDPINPCFAVTTNLTVIPLDTTVTPPSA